MTEETREERAARALRSLARGTEQIDKLYAKRLDDMEQAKWSGAPVTEIAKAAGITRQQVHRILAELKANREAHWATLPEINPEDYRPKADN